MPIKSKYKPKSKCYPKYTWPDSLVTQAECPDGSTHAVWAADWYW